MPSLAVLDSWANDLFLENGHNDPLTGHPYVDPAVPTAPVLGAVTNGNAQGSIAIDTASVLGHGTFVKYQYRAGDGAWYDFDPPITDIDAARVGLTGLVNTSTYDITVRGVATVGEGPASNSVTLSPNA